MKKAYRIFKRKNGYYYLENTKTLEQRSLGTTVQAEAERLLNVENDSRKNPALNRQLGKVYMMNADPESGSRTWQAYQ